MSPGYPEVIAPGELDPGEQFVVDRPRTVALGALKASGWMPDVLCSFNLGSPERFAVCRVRFAVALGVQHTVYRITHID
jgi:hypothetical protein